MSSKLEIILSAQNETGGAIGQVKKALSGLGGAASAAVVAAGVATTAAITGIVGAVGVGVGKAADLEQGLADIASVMGVTFDEAKPLGDLIQTLGIDPKLKVDAVGASDAIMQLAQSGISMQDILDGAARSTVLLSNATGGDMATSAAVASDAMALFGISAKDMTQAVNGITGVTVASKFGINDYQLALAAAGGVASAVGVNFGDFNTAITAIAPNFASGSDAGTSFKTFLSRLVPQSNEAKEAMQALGIITTDGQNRFYDASGSLKSMADISGILQTATKGLTEEQKNATLSVIFGSDAIRAATGLANTGSEGFDKLAGSLAKVDAEQSASTRMNTFSAQLEILQGIVDGLLTQVGQAFLPILRELANWATDYVSKNGAQLVAWFESLANWLKAISPIVVAWGQFLLGALGELTNWLLGQETSFDHLTALWKWLQDAIGAAIKSVVQFIADNLPAWLANLAAWGAAAIQWIVDVWPTVTGKLGELFNGLIAWILSSLPGWSASLAQWGAAAWQWIVNAAGPVKTKLDELWTNTIKPWLDKNAGGLGTSLEAWAGKFTKLTDDIKKGFTKAWPEIEGILDTSKINIVADLERISESFSRIMALFGGEQASNVAVSWRQLWTGIAQALSWAATNSIDQLANFAEGLSVILEMFDALRRYDPEAARAASGRMAEMLNSMNAKNMEILNWVGAQFAGALNGRRADGGPVGAGGRYLVGERGPELFVPKTDGTIVPGAQTQNTYNIYLQGSTSAGNDIMSTVQTLQALYG